MPNFNWFVQCVEDKMDVSQDFTDSPRMVRTKAMSFHIILLKKSFASLNFYHIFK